MTTSMHSNDSSQNTSINGRSAVEEALIRDLAKGLVGTGMELTTTQQCLGGITSQLVYMAGLALMHTTKHHQEKKFERLQTLYHSEKRVETKNDRFHHVYKLTPALVPTKDAQAVIDNDFSCKSRELSLQADKAAQELIGEEQENEKRGQKKKKKNAAKTNNKVVPRDSGNQSLSSDSSNDSLQVDEQQGVLTPINGEQILNSAMVVDEGSSSWIEVSNNKKKPSLLREQESTSSGADVPTECDKTEDTSKVQSVKESPLETTTDPKKNEDTVMAASTESGSVGAAPSSDATENEGEALENTPTSTTAITNNVNKEIATAKSTSNDDELQDDHGGMTNKIALLETRISELESQVAQRETRLRETKADYERAIKAEQLSAEERIQALQLRLFISETRLKTYEDALAHHIEAVAANVSNGNATSTPARGSMTHYGDGKSSTPLFSRVDRLKEKNQLERSNNS